MSCCESLCYQYDKFFFWETESLFQWYSYLVWWGPPYQTFNEKPIRHALQPLRYHKTKQGSIGLFRIAVFSIVKFLIIKYHNNLFKYKFVSCNRGPIIYITDLPIQNTINITSGIFIANHDDDATIGVWRYSPVRLRNFLEGDEYIRLQTQQC